jgi:phage FluMu protein gp41
MDTPSSRLIAAAQDAPEVTDAAGRRIALRRLTALDKLRLFKAAGPGLSQNQPWLGMAVLAASVAAIDDIPAPFPASEAQIEALVQRLGDAGLSAVATGLDSAAPALDVAAHSGN